MNLFVIQHKKTKNLLPIEYNKGGTYWHGEAGRAPRIFHSKKAAYAFVIVWAKGYAGVEWESSEPFGDSECIGVQYVDQGRSRADLVILPASLIIYPEGTE